MRQGNALGLGCHQHIVIQALELLGQRSGASLDQFGVAQDVQHGDPQAGGDLEQRQVALQPGDLNWVCFSFWRHSGAPLRH